MILACTDDTLKQHAISSQNHNPKDNHQDSMKALVSVKLRSYPSESWPNQEQQEQEQQQTLYPILKATINESFSTIQIFTHDHIC